MKSIFRNIIAFVALVGLVYVVSNYYGMFGQMVGVKGASTKRAEEIKTSIQHDVTNQVATAASKAGEIKFSDIFLGLQRFGRIPKDIESIKKYSEEQLRTYLTKKQK